MAKHDIDPVLEQLVRAINESRQAAVPITVSVHGTVLTGALIAEQAFFSELVAGNPLMSARWNRRRACWARSTPRRPRPPPAITCTCGPSASGVTARPPKACGG